jgi:hypothetical protein
MVITSVQIGDEMAIANLVAVRIPSIHLHHPNLVIQTENPITRQ